LLALKIIVEHIEHTEAAAMGGVNVAAIEAALDRAISAGILIAPESLIRRDTSSRKTMTAGHDALS
jgi:hypothetical protein